MLKYLKYIIYMIALPVVLVKLYLEFAYPKFDNLYDWLVEMIPTIIAGIIGGITASVIMFFVF